MPSVVLLRHEREIKLKATKEEYLKNLRDMAKEKELQQRQQQQEEEEFEALARESEGNAEEFEIIETTETTIADT